MYNGWRPQFGFGDYTDADGNLVASNIDTPEGSPSPIPTVSQGPVMNAPAASTSGFTAFLNANGTMVAIIASMFVGLLVIGAGKRR